MRDLDFGVQRDEPMRQSHRPDPTDYPYVAPRRASNGGAIAGILGILFGLLGIFSIGLIFVPLAALCSVVGLLRALGTLSAVGFGLSLLAGAVTAIGAIVSPTIWGAIGSLLLVGTLTSGTANTLSPTRATVVAPSNTTRPAPMSKPASTLGGAQAQPWISQVETAQAVPAPLAPTRNIFGRSGSWTIVRYSPGGCVAQTTNLDGATLSLRRSPNGVAGIAIEYDRLAMPAGRYPYKATMSGAFLAGRDLSLILIVTSDAPSRGVSLIDESVVEFFKQGSAITLTLGSHNYYFDFDDATSALNMSSMCESTQRDPFALQDRRR